MKRITSKRMALFIGVMTAVAIFIYLPIAGHRERKAQQAARQQHAAENKAAAQVAAQNAAAEHAQFLARYEDTAFTKKPGVQAIALAVSSGDGKPDRAISDALVRHFQGNTVQVLPSFLKPPFVSDGFFDRAFNGSDDVSTKLELAKAIDGLLLARANVEYSTNSPDLQNVITATVRLDVADVPVVGNGQDRTWTFTAAGAGFSQTAALKAAEERLAKQISNNTSMSL